MQVRGTFYGSNDASIPVTIEKVSDTVGELAVADFVYTIRDERSRGHWDWNLGVHRMSESMHIQARKAGIYTFAKLASRRIWKRDVRNPGAVQNVKPNNACLNRQVTSESAVRFTAVPQNTIVGVDVVRLPEMKGPSHIGAVRVTGKARRGTKS